MFDHKEVPEFKKVKLISLKLRRYAFIWWTNLVLKWFEIKKKKIKTWAKMKGKLKSRFLPLSDV